MPNRYETGSLFSQPRNSWDHLSLFSQPKSSWDHLMDRLGNWSGYALLPPTLPESASVASAVIPIPSLALPPTLPEGASVASASGEIPIPFPAYPAQRRLGGPSAPMTGTAMTTGQQPSYAGVPLNQMTGDQLSAWIKSNRPSSVLPTINTAVQSLGTLAGLGMGVYSLIQAKDAFDFEKRMAQQNYDKAVDSYNKAYEERIRARYGNHIDKKLVDDEVARYSLPK
jgi:hypothetical protein